MILKNVEKSVRDPKSCKPIVDRLDVDPEFRGSIWVYKYEDKKNGWRLSVSTHGEPGSGKFSLGGFRIAPEARVAAPGYDNDAEAIGLGVGMEEKVYWSRTIRVGGPIGLKQVDRIVGGKCVLLPTADARVGKSRDFELLDFALACLNDFEESTGVFLTTGQDLGHGVMSDGKTQSLRYMYDKFRGSVLADTSKPTAEGNYYTLSGALQGLGIKMDHAQIGILGCGNIGMHLLERLHASGAKLFVLEASETRRKAVEALDIPTWGPSDKAEFLTLPMDALAVNANGGSLDADAIAAINKNEAIEFVCGCENLAMPVAHGADLLREARKIFCPTELCGMMGYLTAVEEYHSRQANRAFRFEDMYEPSRKLEEAARLATELVLKKNFALGFANAVREVYPTTSKAA
jgi:hypothetical protein